MTVSKKSDCWGVKVRTKRRVRSGFTLIELLVVIAVISALMAVLLPSLASARQQARGVKCLANLKALGTGLGVYANDNDNYLPGGDISGSPTPDTSLWVARLWPYTSTQSWSSTAVPDPWIVKDSDGEPTIFARTIWECPFLKEPDTYDVNKLIALFGASLPSTFPQPPRSYGYNHHLRDNDPTTFDKATAIPNASSAAILADLYSSSGLQRSYIARRHPKLLTNVLYVDGHASSESIPLTSNIVTNAGYTNPFWGRAR